MGFVYSKFAKGVHVDGHEYGDVVEYRKKFLEVIERFIMSQ
nr:5053_t:CDS:2 [Entrophospora candida]